MSTSMKKPTSPATREQLMRRIESLLQENRVLKVEVETYKLKMKNLQADNKELRQASVYIVSCEMIS
jgi:coiled-coil domain-containing protein 6